jgi:hypothetical protein
MGQSGVREIVLGDVVWTVYEDARTEAPTYGATFIFASSTIARRVKNYPVHWRSLTDSELLALSQQF